MKEELLAVLSDKEKGTAAFRKASNKLARILVEEMESKLHKDNISGEEIIFVSILRSGFIFMPAFEDKFNGVPIGVVAIRRDKKTSEPKLYYKNFPKHIPPVVIIADSTIYTGGSVLVVIEMLLRKKINPDKIYFLGISATEEGFNKITRSIPRENILLASFDQHLQIKQVALRGIDDFGNRYFGT